MTDADALLFADTLSCDEHRPAAFVPGTSGAAQLAQAQARAETLLLALAQSEETRLDESEEHGELPLAIQRVEAKLDLLLGLFSTLLRERNGALAAGPLRWSTRGARLDGAHESPAVGTIGLLRMQPADWLPDVVELPARVAATDGHRLWLAFDALTPALTEALERHLFRLHRRQIAQSRRTR